MNPTVQHPPAAVAPCAVPDPRGNQQPGVGPAPQGGIIKVENNLSVCSEGEQLMVVDNASWLAPMAAYNGPSGEVENRGEALKPGSIHVVFVPKLSEDSSAHIHVCAAYMV